MADRFDSEEEQHRPARTGRSWDGDSEELEDAVQSPAFSMDRDDWVTHQETAYPSTPEDGAGTVSPFA